MRSLVIICGSKDIVFAGRRTAISTTRSSFFNEHLLGNPPSVPAMEPVGSR